MPMSDKTDSKPAESKRRVKDNEMSDAPEKELTATEEEKLHDEFEVLLIDSYRDIQCFRSNHFPTLALNPG